MKAMKAMKTIKKTICLALILALAAGMAPLTAASEPTNVEDYGDYASIEHVEAVDVLTAVGVMRGDERDGGARNFRPKDNITRAEAAAIIVRAVAGQGTSEAENGVAPFTDMAGYGWANGYVWYCVQNGIIAGYGDGRFGPGDYVTGAQMAAMLLRALGYGVNGEYEGPGWDAQAIIDARRHGVLEGAGVDFLAPANREQVALYTFNALKSPLVTWNSVSGTYLHYGPTLNPPTPEDPGTPWWTMGNRSFGLSSHDGTDGLMYPTRQWYIDRQTNTITRAYRDDDNLVDQFVATTNHTGRSVAGSYSARLRDGNMVNVYTNAHRQTYRSGETFAAPGSNEPQFPVGAHVSLFADAQGFISHIVVVYEVLARVASIATVQGRPTTRVEVYDHFGVTDIPVTNEIFNFDEFGANTWVLIAPQVASGTSLTPNGIGSIASGANFNALRVLRASSVTARIESTRGRFSPTTRHESSMTFNNTTYSLSPGINLGFAGGVAPPLDGNQTIYLDSNGLVIGFTTATADPGVGVLNYVYIRDTRGSQGGGGGGFAQAAAQALVYFTNGNSRVVDLQTNSNNTRVLRYDANWRAIDTPHADWSIPAFEGQIGNIAGKWYVYRMVNDVMQLRESLPLGAAQLSSIDQAVANQGTFSVSTDGESRFALPETVLNIGNNAGVNRVRTGFRNFGNERVRFRTSGASAPVLDALAIMVLYELEDDETTVSNRMLRIFIITGVDSEPETEDEVILLGTPPPRRELDGLHFNAFSSAGTNWVRFNRFDGTPISAIGDIDALIGRIVVVTVDGDVRNAESKGMHIQVIHVRGTSIFVRPIDANGNFTGPEAMFSVTTDTLVVNRGTTRVALTTRNEGDRGWIHTSGEDIIAISVEEPT